MRLGERDRGSRRGGKRRVSGGRRDVGTEGEKGNRKEGEIDDREQGRGTWGGGREQGSSERGEMRWGDRGEGGRQCEQEG